MIIRIRIVCKQSQRIEYLYNT